MAQAAAAAPELVAGAEPAAADVDVAPPDQARTTDDGPGPTEAPSPMPLVHTINEADYRALMERRRDVMAALDEYKEAAESAKDAKKSYDTLRDAFERMFDRVMAGGRADTEPTLPFESHDSAELPHGGIHQSDVVQAAHDVPEYVTMADRLKAMGLDVDAVMVAGYTDDERTGIDAWLSALEARESAQRSGLPTGDLPDVPDVPQILAALVAPPPAADAPQERETARVLPHRGSKRRRKATEPTTDEPTTEAAETPQATEPESGE